MKSLAAADTCRKACVSIEYLTPVMLAKVSWRIFLSDMNGDIPDNLRGKVLPLKIKILSYKI